MFRTLLYESINLSVGWNLENCHWGQWNWYTTRLYRSVIGISSSSQRHSKLPVKLCSPSVSPHEEPTVKIRNHPPGFSPVNVSQRHVTPECISSTDVQTVLRPVALTRWFLTKPRSMWRPVRLELHHHCIRTMKTSWAPNYCVLMVQTRSGAPGSGQRASRTWEWRDAHVWYFTSLLIID